MSKDEAIESGAECTFIDRYPDIVTVYKLVMYLWNYVVDHMLVILENLDILR